MKGEGLERPDWRSRSSFSNRLVSPHRGSNDRKVFASAEQNYQRYLALAREAS
jgi:hypothetical protein